MKVQLQPGTMRLRVDEAELATLLDDGALSLVLDNADAVLWSCEVSLDAAIGEVALETRPPSRWRVRLPAQAVIGYAATLPRRDALEFVSANTGSSAHALRCIAFEVDVRDSMRVRGAARRSERQAASG
ncbi:hypothetical protein ACFFGH_08820 [Lysobacter korlensis]|uniref:Uncharacterized protein n=1 Tax=Lysobacter korlensis TaxID=553636 RepID=A0ABV6RMC4_9GAMM